MRCKFCDAELKHIKPCDNLIQATLCMSRRQLFVIWLTCLFPFASAAHDSHRPDLDQWFNGLKSNYGICCSFVDGTAVLDADWESSNGHYRVRIDGKWYDVPDLAVLDVPNRYGPAIVWRYKDNPTADWKIRCFIPGAGT